MENKPVGVGVIGAGQWGRNIIRALADLPPSLCSLVSIADADAKTRERVGRQHPHTTMVASAEELIHNPAVQAVLVAAPTSEHARLARLALEAGKHTYVEKPLTVTSAEAEPLLKLADEKDLRLMVGHLLLYHPAVEWIKQRMEAGEFGDIYYLYSTRVNLGVVRSYENALWSLAPHDIAVVLYLLGKEPVAVSARGESYLQPGIEDVVFATLHFADRKMAHIHVSWLDPHKVRQFTLVGQKRMVVFNDTHPTEKVRVFDRGADVKQDIENYAQWIALRFGDMHVPTISSEEPLRREAQHFISCCQTGATPRSDGRNGLAVVRILEAASESLKKGGKPIELSSR